jgi:site-specific DNA recombinase
VRPGLDRIMELAEAGKIDMVLAKRRARLFRDRYLRMGYERSLLEHGVRLLALDDGGHRLADAVMDEFGDWWRDQIRDATASGRMEKARQGHIVGSSSPLFGFRFVRDEHRRVVGYEVDPADMEVVRRVIEAVGAEGTVYGAKRTLEAEGVPSPSGSFAWRESTIRRIVFNDAYYPHTRKRRSGPCLRRPAPRRL